VWGESYFERHAASSGSRAPRRHRLTAIAGLGVGGPLLLSALVMVGFSTGASAHTSTINISCTQVQFVYKNFEAAVATAHESVTIDNVQAAQKDITFNGPSATDTITIFVGNGTHTVRANNQWFFNGKNQGHAYASQEVHCGSGHTTTTTCPPKTTTTKPKPTTTTTVKASTTTTAPSTTTSTIILPTTTTTVPETTTTTVPETTTTMATTTTTVPETTTTTATTTTTVPETTTTTVADTTTTITVPEPTTTTTIDQETSTTIDFGTSTTIPDSSSTTTTPVGPEGSTSTTSPVGPQGSTSPPSSGITPTPSGNLPFTGSGPFPLEAALAALGVGMVALGLASLRRVVEQH
jgi:hypothetical protein